MSCSLQYRHDNVHDLNSQLSNEDSLSPALEQFAPVASDYRPFPLKANGTR